MRQFYIIIIIIIIIIQHHVSVTLVTINRVYNNQYSGNTQS